jgi:hypothetical protein
MGERVSSAIRNGKRAGLMLACLGMLAGLGGCVGYPAAAGRPSGYGYTCYAGVYTCQLGAQYPVGTSCSCPGLGAPSYGTVH